MKQVSLILRIVAIAGAVAAVSLYFVARGKIDRKQAQLEEARQKRSSVQSEVDSLNEKLDETRSELEQTESELEQTENTLDSTKSKVYAAQNEAERLKNDLDRAQSKVDELKQEKQKVQQELVATERKLADAVAQSKAAELRQRIDALEQTNEEMKNKLAEARRGGGGTASGAAGKAAGTGRTDDGRGEKQPREPTFAPGTVGPSATVASLDESAGMLVLEAASRLGLSVGDQLRLIDNDLNRLAEVKIRALRNGDAVADILPDSELGNLSANDQVQLMRQ